MLIAYDKDNNRVSIRNTLINEKYYCPICNDELIQKKGSIRCHHFAHKAGGTCVENQYYDTSEWHINWQNKFPIDSQEVIRIDDKGKKHIADVMINKTVIEFQHSNLPFEEFNDRNVFWSNLGYRVIWVFDGNEIFNNGYSGGSIYYRKSLKCLKKQETIPSYMNVFIEGTMNFNLFEEEGTFLYHIGELNQRTGIIFNGKCKIDEFYDIVVNDKKIEFDNYYYNEEKHVQPNENIWKKPDTLINLFERIDNTEKIIAYNPKIEKDVLLDRDNYLKMKNGKTAYGKMRPHMKYGKFFGDKIKIFYPNDNNWIMQWYITEKENKYK